VQSVVDAYGSGTTFCFAPGLYVLTSFVTPKSYDRLISVEPRAAIFTGSDVSNAGLRGTGTSSGQHDVTVQGFVIEHFVNAALGGSALQAGWNWTIVGNEVAYNSNLGVGVNNGTILSGNFIHHNGRYGFGGGPLQNLTVDANEVSFNNTRHYDPNNDAGGSKIIGSSAGSTGIVETNNYVHDNYGNGLWCDWDCIGARINGNHVTGNLGAGIFYEAGFGPASISGNTLSGNCTGFVGRSVWWCAEIYLNDSQGVDIAGNTITAGTNGLGASDTDRGSTPFGELMICDVTAHNNAIVLPVGGTNGWVTNRTDPCPRTPFTLMP
jgi:hypothetical protein